MTTRSIAPLIVWLLLPAMARAENITIDDSCSAIDGKHGQIRDAWVRAGALAAGAANWLWTVPDDGDHEPFVRWMGPWDTDQCPGRLLDGVRTRMGAINNALHAWEFRLDCADANNVCDRADLPSAFAYVYASDGVEPLPIHLCPKRFYNSDMAGTFIHEVSHFNRNDTHNVEGAKAREPADQQDWYAAGTMLLAKNKPCLNLNNSFAYEGLVASDPGQVYGAPTQDPTGGCGGAESSSTGNAACSLVTSAERGRHGNSLCVCLALGIIGFVRRRTRLARSLASLLAAVIIAGLIAGCATMGPRLRTARKESGLVPIDDRLSCWVDAPVSLRSGQPFPIRISVQNVSGHTLNVSVSRSPLFIFMWCDKDRELRDPLIVCPAGGTAPPPPPVVLEALAPGQSIFRDIDMDERERSMPGQCHFHDNTSLEVQVGSEMHTHRVRCSVPASVEVTP